MLSWRARRQLIVLLIAALPLAAIGFWIVPKFLPEPTCFDNRKNQGELDIDCGGPCAPCELKNPKSPQVFFARAARVRQDLYDAVALIENPNEEIGAGRVEYEFTLFDKVGLLARRTGRTFFLPGERFHLIEPAISTSRMPTRVEFRLLDIKWQTVISGRPSLAVERRDYKVIADDGHRKSSVEADIINRSPFDLRDALVNFAVLDKEGNILGLNKILVEGLPSGARKSVISIWPEEFGKEPTAVEVESRVNVFDPNVILRP